MAEDKIPKYRGKSLEELKELSLEEFSKLLPSRERRKINRGFTDAEKIFLENLKNSKGKKIKTHCRDLIVLPEMVEEKIAVYNGKEFIDVKLGVEVLGLRLGELAMSRKIATHTTMGSKKTTVRK